MLLEFFQERRKSSPEALQLLILFALEIFRLWCGCDTNSQLFLESVVFDFETNQFGLSISELFFQVCDLISRHLQIVFVFRDLLTKFSFGRHDGAFPSITTSGLVVACSAPYGAGPTNRGRTYSCRS